MERKCYKCKKIKSIESFVKDNRNKTGYGYLCKECKKRKIKSIMLKLNKIQIDGQKNQKCEGIEKEIIVKKFKRVELNIIIDQK